MNQAQRQRIWIAPMGNTAVAPRRRTQSERSASSRAEILRSAIHCLSTYGYSATTMSLLASTANMSMGRMQHQFSTKAQVMAAVVEFVFQENTALLSPEKLAATDPLGRVREYTHLLHEVFERDSVLAALEIRLAMRSDEELRDAVAPLIAAYDSRSFSELESLLVDARIPPANAHVWMRLMIATVRGLALERALHYRTTAGLNSEDMLNMVLDLLTGDVASPAKR